MGRRDTTKPKLDERASDLLGKLQWGFEPFDTEYQNINYYDVFVDKFDSKLIAIYEVPWRYDTIENQ